MDRQERTNRPTLTRSKVSERKKETSLTVPQPETDMTQMGGEVSVSVMAGNGATEEQKGRELAILGS